MAYEGKIEVELLVEESDPIVTELAPFKVFYPAQSNHPLEKRSSGAKFTTHKLILHESTKFL